MKKGFSISTSLVQAMGPHSLGSDTGSVRDEAQAAVHPKETG
jgi:hypothetical protein